MKKLLSIIIICLLLIPLSSCYKAPEYDMMVYKTSTGAKYHKENCQYVRGKAIEINLSKALYDGLEACKVCRPQSQVDLDKLNK